MFDVFAFALYLVLLVSLHCVFFIWFVFHVCGLSNVCVLFLFGVLFWCLLALFMFALFVFCVFAVFSFALFSCIALLCCCANAHLVNGLRFVCVVCYARVVVVLMPILVFALFTLECLRFVLMMCWCGCLFRVFVFFCVCLLLCLIVLGLFVGCLICAC